MRSGVVATPFSSIRTLAHRDGPVRTRDGKIERGIPYQDIVRWPVANSSSVTHVGPLGRGIGPCISHSHQWQNFLLDSWMTDALKHDIGELAATFAGYGCDDKALLQSFVTP